MREKGTAVACYLRLLQIQPKLALNIHRKIGKEIMNFVEANIQRTSEQNEFLAIPPFVRATYIYIIKMLGR